MNTPRTAADWHRYLHREGILVPDEGDECGPWHHRVFIEAEATAGRPMIECLCGDLLLTVEDMFEHLRIQHALDDCPEAEAAAPTLAELPRTRGDGTVAYEPSDEPAEPLDVERLALSIVALPESWDMDLRTEEAVKQYAARIAAEYNRRSERREALRKLSQDASDLGIYE